MPVMELARDVYRSERTIGPTGTIQGLTKAQVAFMWAVVSSSTSAGCVHVEWLLQTLLVTTLKDHAHLSKTLLCGAGANATGSLATDV